jgi:prolyl-tRNA synthetase
MRQSHLFTKTRKEAPKDEVSKNAELLIRAGYIHKEMAGVYSYLPLGLRVLNNIANIVREEINVIGGQEALLTVLQDKNNWEKTGRWSDEVVDNWFKTKLKNDTEVGLGFTHEEQLTLLMKDRVRSFRDLPSYVYQIQTKFRNEARAKSGIIRGREFLMKDLYSFSKNEMEHQAFYEKAKLSYKKIFERVGIGQKTHLTFASGGSFAKFSHEFQTVALSGEDTIYVCKNCSMGINDEIYQEQKTCPECAGANFTTEKAVEVGNIFSLGTKFSAPLGLKFVDEKGEEKNVIMGSYGIGIGRLMGVVTELFCDEKGIVWPESVAPFDAHLISVTGKEESGESKVKNYADKLYKSLHDKGIEVLYDDREMRAGEKFADSDLIGIPYRIVVSEKTMEENVIELKKRSTGEVKKISEKELEKLLTAKLTAKHMTNKDGK